MAKTVIKYEDGFEWKSSYSESNIRGITTYCLYNKDNEMKAELIVIKSNNVMSTKTSISNEEVPYVENLMANVKPSLLSNMPYALTEDGNYYVGEDKIKTIPDDIVLKDVNISFSKNITEWNRPVVGDFYAVESNLEKFGPNAAFGGRVDISDTTNITEFNHKVPGEFRATDCNLTTIGPDAEFGGDVYIGGSNLTEWNHKIEGFLNANDSNLTTIGPNAEFGSFVEVMNCKNLTEWNCKVPDDFDAYGSALTTIGPDAEFGGDVDIKNCKNLTEFNHKVEGYFDADDSGLTNIGPNAEFGRNVDISRTPLSKEIGMDVIKTPEGKQELKDACQAMNSKQEQEQIPEPEEEEHSMSM